MRTSRWIGSIGLLLSIASCGQPAANQSAPTTTVAVSPAVAAPPVAQSPTEAMASPLSVVPPAPSVLPVPNLIPPTSSEVRVPQIQAGRDNPYGTVTNGTVTNGTVTNGTVTTTPRVTVSPAASPRPSVPTVAVQPAPARSTPASAPASTVNRPALRSNPSPAAVAAPPPQATPARPTAELARSIAVSGVVQTSGRTSAIVQVPQEGSRYVSVGDRLAGGRVLVKRIDARTGEAIVVFEQDGVEVSRSIGTGAP